MSIIQACTHNYYLNGKILELRYIHIIVQYLNSADAQLEGKILANELYM